MSSLIVACIQMRSGINSIHNIEAACTFIRQAAAGRAQLVATPEMTNILDIRPTGLSAIVVPEADDPSLAALGALAKELGIWLLIGSLALAIEGDTRRANRSVLIAPSGKIAARYDKINMFDVEIGDGQTYRESGAYRAGKKAVTCETPLGHIGFTICYDVRFPGLYRSLAQAGAQIITCPAAFTEATGRAHWHTLLRARAIETGAFILAPAQGGLHEDGRCTFGHSLIISPWGEVLAECDGNEPGILLAEIDLADVGEARRKIPAFRVDQPWSIETVTAL